MERRLRALKGAGAGLIVLYLSARTPAQLINIAPGGDATQTSNYPCCGGFPAELAIDLDFNNFTATAPDDPAPSWQVDLGIAHAIKKIAVHNRRGCCPERLRDITVSILEAPAGATKFQSDLLNEGNVLGSPGKLELDIVALAGAAVSGRVVQVARTPDPAGTGDDVGVMSLAEVEVFTDDTVQPVFITRQPRGGRVEIGGSFEFSVGATGPEPLSYRWKKGGAEIGGAIASKLFLQNVKLEDAGIYTVVVAGGGGTAESDPAELIVTPVNLARSGIAIQSSDYGPFVASLAIDNNYGNFTATATGDDRATWEVDLGEKTTIDDIVVFNRGDGCCQSRLRDIVISVHDVSFIIDPDSAPLYESDLLNPENALGGGSTGGPPFLGVELDPKVTGRYVRVARLPDPDLSGTGGLGDADEPNLLSMGEVEVHGQFQAPCPDPGDAGFGDTHCNLLTVDGPPDMAPGTYTATAAAADQSGGDVLYTFTATNGFNAAQTEGPGHANTADFQLGVGKWTISVTVDDSLFCSDQAADAVCSTNVEVPAPDSANKAYLRPARQSSDWGGGQFPAALAVDGNLGNFTATRTEDDNATWEVDLLEEIGIRSIAVYNRGDGCCQSRLRDITVSILDAAGAATLFESDLLNPENVLGGGGTGGPPLLLVPVSQLAGGPVKGRMVRVHRAPDPDLSGTRGLGNADEPNVLSLGEVEVYDTDCGDGTARCSEISVQGPAGDLPGIYTVTATGSGDPIFYTFTASNGQDPPLVVGPTDIPLASFDLTTGTWTITVKVGDLRHCSNTAPGASCSQQVIVKDLCVGTNVARAGLATQSTNSPCCGGFPAELAIDGRLETFAATAPDDPSPAWQVDLGSIQSVNSIVIHNRADCCPERLRDITVSILDAGGVEVEFQSEVLNPGNFLGGPAYLALNLVALAGKSVSGQIVRITRAPDPFASGDDAAVLSVGEVEVCAGAIPPPLPRFRRGDVDGSGVIDITDPVGSLAYQFLGASKPACLDALDDDDSGTIDITDPIYSLTYQFNGGPPQPAPGINTCGVDPTADSGAPDGKDLGCLAYTAACNP